MLITCLGIAREPTNSPGRESDDALILKAVLDQVEGLRIGTRLMTPEEADRSDLSGYQMVLPMCEAFPRLMRLRTLEGSSVVMVNPPTSVLACYRTEMIKAFEPLGQLNFPPTELRPIHSTGTFREPCFDWSPGLWVKRGDVHNTTTRDVVYARDLAEAEAWRLDFERRGIRHMILQRHVDGDLIKFYGVGPGQWFTWFYHDPASARRFPFAIDELAAAVKDAAGSVGLEVFGGDAIITADSTVHVIDINSWPSFAKVREEAARQIAWHLSNRLKHLRLPAPGVAGAGVPPRSKRDSGLPARGVSGGKRPPWRKGAWPSEAKRRIAKEEPARSSPGLRPGRIAKEEPVRSRELHP